MKAIELYLGLDVHKDSITLAIAPTGRSIRRCVACSGSSTISGSLRLSLPNKTPGPAQPHEDQKENQVAQPKPSGKSQRHCQTQQTRQNTNEQTVSDTGFPGASSDNNGSKKSQGHLKPRHQPGTDSRGKVTDGRLVWSAPSLKGQAKRVGGNDDRHDEETQRDNRERRAKDAEPANT